MPCHERHLHGARNDQGAAAGGDHDGAAGRAGQQRSDLRSGLGVVQHDQDSPSSAGAGLVPRRSANNRPSGRAPVFVLTHTPREPWVRQGGTTFTFVTEGIDSALARAREAAGDRDVQISGGADVVRQYLGAGLLDELQIHLAPIVLGSGVRLFDGVSPGLGLVPMRVVDSPQVTHLTYRITSS